jgi:hypothetical protein
MVESKEDNSSERMSKMYGKFEIQFGINIYIYKQRLLSRKWFKGKCNLFQNQIDTKRCVLKNWQGLI